ncbi:S-adenosylmethionine decarboxylase [Candidatus Microgenomates bacterium]|nr:S-adenosylmethionine decarboxylase [Candidatus Microgenomates bacterium]
MPAGRYHIIIHANGVNNDSLTDKEGLTNFLNILPGKINMSILNPPVVVEGIPANPGLSGFVIIDFSHISIHTFTEYNQVMVDIFSCKPYDQEDATQAVLDYFQVPREQAMVEKVYWGE